MCVCVSYIAFNRARLLRLIHIGCLGCPKRAPVKTCTCEHTEKSLSTKLMYDSSSWQHRLVLLYPVPLIFVYSTWRRKCRAPGQLPPLPLQLPCLQAPAVIIASPHWGPRPVWGLHRLRSHARSSSLHAHHCLLAEIATGALRESLLEHEGEAHACVWNTYRIHPCEIAEFRFHALRAPWAPRTGPRVITRLANTQKAEFLRS